MRNVMAKLSKQNKRVIVFFLVVALLFTTFIGAFASSMAAKAVYNGSFIESDFETRDDVTENSEDVNALLLEEGAVLLKNDTSGGGGLPLKPNAKVTLLGNNAYDMQYGGVGSSGQVPRNQAIQLDVGPVASAADVATAKINTGALANAGTGITVNPDVREWYYNKNGATATELNAWRSKPGQGSAGSYYMGLPIGEMRATGDTSYANWNASSAPDADKNYDPANQTAGYSNYQSVRQYYSAYDDAVIIAITRVGGEAFDLPQTMAATSSTWSSGYTYDNNASTLGTYVTPGARERTDHYLQLDQNEANLIKEAGEYFDNVIVLINSATPIELGFLDDVNHYAYHKNVKAALWVGYPGQYGADGIGRVLAGTANPSGSLPDVFPRNILSNPAMMNFGKDASNIIKATAGDTLAVSGAANRYWRTDAATQQTPNYNYVEYQEDMYVGYRYYETRWQEIYNATAGNADAKKAAADAWYKENVVYPLGYGMSYSSFSMEILKMRIDGIAVSSGANATVTGKSEIEIDVKVTNTGTVKGKKAVQLYGQAPYTAGGIEKSSKVLIGYDKTETLYPKGSQTVTIKAPIQYLSSFDWDDKNANSFKGYELDSGRYNLFIAGNSNDSSLSTSFNLTAGLKIDKDPVTDAAVTPQFAYMSNHMKTNSAILSRANNFANYNTLTPLYTRRKNANVTAAFITSLGDQVSSSGTRENLLSNLIAETGAPVLTVAAKPYPTEGTYVLGENVQQSVNPGTASQTLLSYDNAPIKFRDMWNVDYDDPLWDQFLNQLSFDDMGRLVAGNRFSSRAIVNVGKPLARDWDGPVGFVVNTDGGANNTGPLLKFCSTPVIAATMNHKLQTLLGEHIGEEGLWGNSGNRGASNVPTNGNNMHSSETTEGASFSGWYAPGANVHRTPFSGRNFEYLSEDPVLSGITMGNIVVGAQKKGVASFMKHFFLNDQETNRDGDNSLVTWATEQAMREIYSKAWEIAIKMQSKAAAELGREPTMAVMTAFNRIGIQTAAGCYPINQVLLRDEWGFKGQIISDWAQGFHYIPRMLLGANDKKLGTDAIAPIGTGWTVAPTDADAATLNNINTYKWALRTAAKNILFSNANGNMMNTTETMTAPAVTLSADSFNTDGSGYKFAVGASGTYNLKTELTKSSLPVAQHYGSKNPDNYTYSYSLREDSNMPVGLTVSSAGVISGTPRQAGTFQVEVFIKATESLAAVTSGTGATAKTWIPARTVNYVPYRQIINLEVTTALAPTDDVQLPASVFLGTAPYGKSSSFTVPNYMPNGGGFTYTYALAAGTVLPAGLSFTASTGVISGTPTAGQGSYTYWFYVKYQKTETATSTVTTYVVMLGIQIGAPYDDTAVLGLISGLQNQINNMKDDVAVMQINIAEIQGEIEAIQDNITAAQGDISALKGEIATVKSNITAIQGEIATIKTNITTINGLISSLDAEKDSEVAALNQKITGLQSDLSAMETLSKDLKDLLTALTGRVDTLEKAGCGSSVDAFGSFGFAIAAITIAGALVLLLKRRAKKED